ncbi:hypothetical protein [Cyanobacterium aponinum]|uniref:hypothetical protein n=1 Tax=Cyanobacterium aponinum TaxID=379064 RepID=UPI001055ABEE|nr:hypothetical protein [Cyanobacterium aponinum]
MKKVTIIIVGITLLSTIGITSLAKAMTISNSLVKYPINKTSSLHKPFSVAEAVESDRDKETNDDVSEQQQGVNL